MFGAHQSVGLFLVEDGSGLDIDDAAGSLGITEGAWTTLSGAGSGELVIEFASNSSSETAAFDNIQWMSVLRSLAGLQMYRRDVRLRVTGPHVLRYLLQNRDFPRSVTHHFLRIEKLLPQLPNKRPVERALQRVKALTRDADIDALVESGLGDFMDEIQIGIGRLHQEIAGSYFSS